MASSGLARVEPWPTYLCGGAATTVATGFMGNRIEEKERGESMKPKEKSPGSAKQRGLSKLTIKNYHRTLRCVNTDTQESDVIACQGFTDVDPLRIKVHRGPKTRSRRRRKQADPEQLVWAEVLEWLVKLNNEAAS